MKNQESSLIGEVKGPLEVRWEPDSNKGSLFIPTMVRDRKIMVEAPLRKVVVGDGELVIGVGVSFMNIEEGAPIRATGYFSAQPIRVVVGKIDRLRHSNVTRCGLYLQGVVNSYDRFGVARVELDDGSVVKAELPIGIMVGTGERIGARGFPAKNPNTLRLVDVVIIAAE